MTYHQFVNMLMSLLIFHVFSQSIPTAVGQELKGKELMKKVCENTEFPAECIAGLDSHPDTVNADMTALARLAMVETGIILRKGFTSTVSRVSSNVDKDPRILASLSFCCDCYKIAIDRIHEGMQMFDQQRYDQSYGLTESAIKSVLNCNNQRLEIMKDHNLAAFRLAKDTMKIIQMLY